MIYKVLCVGCKHYRRAAGAAQTDEMKKMLIPTTPSKYSACARPGALPIAMDERRNGECGPDATKKE